MRVQDRVRVLPGVERVLGVGAGRGLRRVAARELVQLVVALLLLRPGARERGRLRGVVGGVRLLAQGGGVRFVGLLVVVVHGGGGGASRGVVGPGGIARGGAPTDGCELACEG